VDALGVISALEIQLHEEGGVFDGPRHGRPRAATEGQKLQHGLTADEINKELPGIAGLDAVPSTGWWKGGHESSVESLERAVLSAKWLWGLVEQDNEEGELFVFHMVSSWISGSRQSWVWMRTITRCSL